MSAAASEKFELTLKALQGRWMHEPLNALLKVRGMQVTFNSGEMYMLERASEKEFECFGFVAQEAQSTASEIVWKNPETGDVVKWHFEGEADAAYEVDPGNILTGRRSRRSVLDQPIGDLPERPAKKPKLEESEITKSKNKKFSEKPAKPAKAEKDQKTYLAAVNKGIGNFKSWLASVSSQRHSAEQEISGSLDLPEISDPHVARRMEEFVDGHAGFSGRASQGKLGISASPHGLRQALAKYGLAANGRVDELAGVLAGEEQEKAALLEIFNELGGISMNVETLKRTLLGAKVNKFSKAADADVAASAKALVEKWKDVYRQEAIKQQQQQQQPAPASPTSV